MCRILLSSPIQMRHCKSHRHVLVPILTTDQSRAEQQLSKRRKLSAEWLCRRGDRSSALTGSTSPLNPSRRTLVASGAQL